MVGRGVAQGVEKPSAAARMAPAFGIRALGIGAHVQELRPRLIVELRGMVRAREVCLTAVAELDFRALTAVGAGDEQHRECRSMSHGGCRGFIDQVTVAEALDGERRVDRVWLVARNGPGKYMRRSRCRLEPAGAPTAV